jgi:CDP-diacylglycerol--glycerol-3-phosphate 3-phosphatidyltransferase
MVIIARELAVTMSRVAASGQGLIIAANRWGKLKTATQVATIFLLIAVHGSPAWLDALVYLTVAITVISGIDYFFGLRRRLGDRARAGEHAA